jgi:hypothetical protein
MKKNLQLRKYRLNHLKKRSKLKMVTMRRNSSKRLIKNHT